MNQQRNKMYIRFGQGQSSGSGNWLSRILSLFLLLVFIGLAVTFGFFILLIGLVLMIPVLWRQRHAIKQAWRMRQQAKAEFENSKAEYQRQQQQARDSQDSTIIEGEYEQVDEEDKR